MFGQQVNRARIQQSAAYDEDESDDHHGWVAKAIISIVDGHNTDQNCGDERAEGDDIVTPAAPDQ